MHTVYTAIFWLNAFPNMSEKQWFSPKEIITGLTIVYKRNCKKVVGTYIEASIDADITNGNVKHQNIVFIWACQETVKDPSHFFGIDTDAVVVRRIFDVLSYPDVLMKKWKIGTNVENVPFSGEELIF